MKHSSKLILVLFLGFTLNLIYAFFIAPLGKHDLFVLEKRYTGIEAQTFFHHDAKDYIYIAVNLLQGKGYSYPLENPHPTALRLPGYPLFLALLFSLFGFKISCALFFQCILLTVLFFLAYILAKHLFSEKTALFSLLVMIFLPNLKFYGCAYIGPETLAAVLLFAGIVCFLQADPHKRFWIWNSAGMCSCISAGYCRPDFFLFFPFVCFWMMRHYQRRWFISVCLFTALTASFLLPWTLRNFSVFDTFVPGSTIVGRLLSGSYNPQTMQNNPGGWDNPNSTLFGIDETGKNEVEINKLHTQYAWNQIQNLSVPQAVRLVVWKAVRLWLPVQRLIRGYAGGINLKELAQSPLVLFKKPAFLFNIVLSVLFLPVYLLFGIKLIVSMRSFRKHELIFYLFCLVNLVALIFLGSIRYRFVFEPIIIIYGCALILDLFKRAQHKFIPSE
ncbi:glycosyltransferase family 39 protein [bacterium]|nr:glycosyltransferase family 39 protein [bacterium]MCP5463018.1 glycosyltransferase family 39 protein [bacterium]